MEAVDWSTEWWRSLVWIFGVWVLVLVGFALLVWLLVKRTGWGRQFWRLSSMFFIPYQRSWRAWRPLLTVALLLLLHRDPRPAGRDPVLQQQRPLHRDPGVRHGRLLAVGRHLRHPRHDQRRAESDQLLHRPGAGHPLAAVAQPADGGGLDDGRGVPPRPVRRGPGGQPGPAHPGRRRLVRRHVPVPGSRPGGVVHLAGLVQRRSCGGCPDRSSSVGSPSRRGWCSSPTST